MKHMLFAGLVITLLAGASAEAAVVTTGSPYAEDCYRAALVQRDDVHALERCNTALREDFLTRRDRAATLVNRGIIHLYRGSFHDALRDFDAAIAAYPNLAEGHVHRGVALNAFHDWRGAIESLDRGLQLEPEEPAKAHFNRAIAHEELGDVAAAYHDYRRAAELAPEWSPPQRELTRFQVRR